MFNVGPAELLVIFVIALLVFGPNKLPEVGRQVGRAVNEFRRFQSSLRDEVRDVFEPVYGGEPPRLPPRATTHDALGAPPVGADHEAAQGDQGDQADQGDEGDEEAAGPEPTDH